MNLRRGIVVATHPEDHSVDLVMADDGSRLVGVQVATPNGSTRSGTVDLPAVPPKKDKWDITKPTGQDMIALVGSYGRHPIVVGFLYPQINQMLSKDPKRRVFRHQSDVQWSIDGDGNVQLDHPSGTYVRIGEEPDREDTEGKNADGNAKLDRNTSKRVNVRIGLAGGKGTLTITPDGKVRFDLKDNFEVESTGDAVIKAANATVEASGSAEVKAPAIKFDTPSAHFTGSVQVDQTLNANIDVTAAGVSLVNHKNTGVMAGPSLSGPPAPGS